MNDVNISMSKYSIRVRLLDIVPESIKLKKFGRPLSESVNRNIMNKHLARNWDEELQAIVEAAVLKAKY